jgi:hypothetical protein
MANETDELGKLAWESCRPPRNIENWSTPYVRLATPLLFPRRQASAPVSLLCSSVGERNPRRRFLRTSMHGRVTVQHKPAEAHSRFQSVMAAIYWECLISSLGSNPISFGPGPRVLSALEGNEGSPQRPFHVVKI